MRKFLALTLAVATISYADTLEKKLKYLQSIGGLECAPQELGMAESYIEAYKGLPEKTTDGIKVVPISEVDRIIYKNKAEVELTKAESKIFGDVDGDGVPCYEEVKNGTNPFVADYPKVKKEPPKVAKAEKTPPPPPKKVEKPKKKEYKPLLTQARIHFEFNKATIKKEYMPYLNVIAKYLKAHKNLKVKIVGYTDNIGSEKYNKKLALKRAKAVKNALVKFGISPDRIEIVGKGKTDFLFDNKTKLNRFTNRRADFFILETN